MSDKPKLYTYNITTKSGIHETSGINAEEAVDKIEKETGETCIAIYPVRD